MRFHSTLLGLLLLGSLHLAQAQTIRYVRANGTNTNPATATSWATATADLQGAINAGAANDQVWIAGGTYKPGGNANTNRSISFNPKNGVSIYGGFVGNETALSQRPLLFISLGVPSSTTLSGEIGNPAVTTDNSYHVVTNNTFATVNFLLDGVVITGGRADGSADNSYGGGLVNAGASNQTSNLTLRNCLFTGNYASGSGGALVNFAYSNGSAAVDATNCVFTNNVAHYWGGAVFNGKTDSNPNNSVNQGRNQLTMADCHFTGNYTENISGEGGAIRLNSVGDATVSTFNRCRFDLNYSRTGGVLYNLSGSPVFKNCGFTRNYALNYGGVIYTLSSTTFANPGFINCSFTANPNQSSGTAVGAVLFLGGGANVQFTNSVIFGNAGNNTLINEVPSQSSIITATSCLLDNTVTDYTGTGNNTTTTSPFSSTNTLATHPCAPVLNGSNSTATTAFLGSTDLVGNARIVGVAADLGAVEYRSVPPGPSAGAISSNGATGTIVLCPGTAVPPIQSQTDGFSNRGYSWQSSTNGAAYTTIPNQTGVGLTVSAMLSAPASQTMAYRRVSVDCPGTTYPTAPITFVLANTAVGAGSIGGPPIVSSPQEGTSVLSSAAVATAGYNLSLTWQQSEDGTNWVNLTNSNAQSISLPPLSTGDVEIKTFQFRRVAQSGCSSVAPAYSPVVLVKVVRITGKISGKVVSTDNVTGVEGITITVRRITTGLAGSPDNYTYSTVTRAGGLYDMAPIYWGFRQGTTPASVTASTFITTPTRTGHTFSPTSLTNTMNEYNNEIVQQNITDLTTYAISGGISQSCPDCITGTSGQTVLTGPRTCPLDSADVRVIGGNYSSTTKSGLLDGVYGRYGLVVLNPGSYTVTPSYRNYAFTPATQTFALTGDIPNVHFTSPTSRTITGRLTAGCDDPIGSAVLEFRDVLPNDVNGNARLSCFVKRVTTSNSGDYAITLPVRKYSVRVVSFTSAPGSGSVSSTDLIPFFNAMLTNTPAALTRDLTSTTANTTLNLVYQRPPTLLLAGLPTPPGCGTVASFGILKQGIPASLSVTVYQGPLSKGCPVSSGTVLVSTNVRQSGGESIVVGFPASSSGTGSTVVTGTASLTLVPGLPNVAAPYYRSLTVQYTDAFGQPATSLSRNVVVTGVQAGTATFTTVSPQIPLLVLHDPPGDNSFSFWNKETVQERALRFYAASSDATKAWLEVKIGTKFETGIGVMVENELWGTIGGGITASTRKSSDNETIFSTKTNSYIATSSSSNNVGDDADLFVGAALNLWYAISTVIAVDPASCSVSSSQKLVVAQNGVAPATQYYYTANEIRTIVLVDLERLLSLATTRADSNRYANQITVWEQVLKNNEDNKKRAVFIANYSFGQGVNEISESVSRSVTKTNTIEFSMSVDTEIAVALGFEIAGSGASGGLTCTFKMESGNSEANTSTTAVTTGYTLKDDDAGDLISVDIQTDPVYGTPAFKLLGGRSSCPAEANAQPRDVVEFSSPVPVVSNVPPSGAASFTLNFSNISQVISDPSRTFILSFDPSTNPNSAGVTINGSTNPIAFTVNRLQQRTATVIVQRNPLSNVYTYDGLEFHLTDDCVGGSGGLDQVVRLSATFQSPCSSVALTIPEPGWITTLADQNSLPVQISGYNVANLTNVSLEYTPQGSSNWATAFTKTAAQLNNSVNGTAATWNTTGLDDGNYNLRLKLTCPLGNGGTGTVYSPWASGTVDRTPPALFGNTQPLNSTYVTGSTIGATYDEALSCSRIKNSTAPVLTRLGNGQVIPATVGCSNNQIVIVPMGSLAPFVGEVLSVTLTGIADVFGNVKPTPDIWTFRVGSSTAATGGSALSVVAGGGAGGGNAPASPNKSGGLLTMNEDAPGTMAMVFQLPQPAPNNIFVNFSVAGTASFGVDYTTSYVTSSTTAQPLSATVTGATGQVMIPAGASSVTLLVDPVADTRYETDETVVISLLEGGNYGISVAVSITATILNDDPASNANVITSIHTGNWEDPETWDLVRIPLATDEVILDQTHTVTLSTTGNAKKVTPRQNARLRLPVTTAKLRLGF